MILDFWYSARCTRQIKLIVCITTCVMIYLCATVAPLSPVFTMISLVIGMAVHGLRVLSLKITADNPYRHGFSILFLIMPMIALMTLISSLSAEHQVILILQVLSFTALGLFLLSTFPHRKFN